MLSNTGNILIFGSIFFTISIIFIAFRNLRVEIYKLEKIWSISIFQITFIITSFLLLIFAFVISDFSLLGVYQNSHISKPLFYKIAGVWGNHEGSLLLWINVMVVFSYLFLYSTIKQIKFIAFTHY